MSAKWSKINSFFSSLILIFHQYSVLKIHFYYTILQDSIRRHPGLELKKALVLLMRVEGANSQLDLPSLTPLSEADCGQLQLGALHWATSVELLPSFRRHRLLLTCVLVGKFS